MLTDLFQKKVILANGLIQYATSCFLQPRYRSGKRGQLIFLSPCAVTRCDLHIRGSPRPCSHRPSEAVVLGIFFVPRVTQSDDDACYAASEWRNSTLSLSICLFSAGYPGPRSQNKVVTSVAPATGRSGSIIDGFRQKSKQGFFCPM